MHMFRGSYARATYEENNDARIEFDDRTRFRAYILFFEGYLITLSYKKLLGVNTKPAVLFIRIACRSAVFDECEPPKHVRCAEAILYVGCAGHAKTQPNDIS